jgi:hypothetical protein
VCCNLCIFMHETGRQNILNEMAALIPSDFSALDLLVNRILICYSRFQIFELRHSVKEFCSCHWNPSKSAVLFIIS